MLANKMIRRAVASFTLCMLLFTVAMPAAQANPAAAGQVMIAKGSVQAVSAAGEIRVLQRRSPFYTGETIRTAAASTVQLRFSDGALMSLRADSVLKVDAYEFQNQGGDGDRSMSTLIKGGLRTITGVIGKHDPAAYVLNTPVATIGVRGTHYEAVLEAPNSLVLAAWQGTINVRNENGAVDLGAGVEFNFARSERGRSPQGLLEAPAALREATPVGLMQPKNKPPATPQTTAQEGGDTPDADTDNGAESLTATEIDTDVVTDFDAATKNDVQSTFGSLLASPLGNLSSDPACATCVPPQQFTVTTPGDLPSVADRRFSATEWDKLQTTPYLGVAVLANNTPDFGIKGGRVLNFGSHTPVFVDNSYGPGDPLYPTAPIQDVIRIGDASVDAFGSSVIDTAHTFYWGTWNGALNPIEVQVDATDPSIVKPIYNPLHWATLLPTELGAMAARSGSVSYNSVSVAHGGGSGGGPLTPGNVAFNANVNFNTGNITSGFLNINNGPEAWVATFAGKIAGNVLDVKLDATSNVTVSPAFTPQLIEGDLGLAFTGNTGQAIGGGFSLQAIGNPATHVEGVLLVQ